MDRRGNAGRVMLNQEETELLLDHLIDIINERRLGYAKAAEKINDPYLKELFRGHSNQSKLLSQELATALLGTIETPPGHKHNFAWRYWLEMKEALHEETRISILNACIKGEERTIDVYQGMISDKHLSSEFRSILQKQFNQIKQASDLIKIFKIVL